MISMLLYLLIGALIFSVAWWALSKLPLPEPVRIIVIVALAIVAVIFLAQLLPQV